MKEAMTLEAIPSEVFAPLDNMNYWDSPNQRGIAFLKNKLKTRKFLQTEQGLVEFTEVSPREPWGGIVDHVMVYSTK